VQDAFRRVLLDRVNLYRAGGLAALPPLADRASRPSLDESFDRIIAASPYLTRVPDVAWWLAQYPRTAGHDIESFFYWSKESYGSGKAVVTATHVGIVRPRSGASAHSVLVMGKQILATHYMNGSLGLTAVLREAPGDPGYFIYINRSQTDVLGGLFGGLMRRVLEGRLTRDTPEIIRGLRTRLESGAPPIRRQ
jgi:hypothetical protein